MHFQVYVTRRAERELNFATDWYAEYAVDLGKRWTDGVRRAIASLANNPDRCGLAHESDQFGFETRELLYGLGRKKTHRILFRILP